MSGTRKKPYGPGVGASSRNVKKTVDSVSRSQHPRASGFVSSSRAGESSVMSRGKNVQASASEKAALPPSKAPFQVFDERGHDVTPLPLIEPDTLLQGRKMTNILDNSNTTLEMGGSIYQVGTVTASTFGGGPFTRSVFSSHSGRSTYLGSVSEDIVESSAGEVTTAWTETKVRYKREEVKEELNEEDLEKPVPISLMETDTIWLLDIIGVSVSLESEEAEHIKEQNEAYMALVKARPGNDRYVERGMNTFNELPKVKNIQTNKISHNEVGVMVTLWDMYDSYELAAKLEAAEAKTAEQKAEEEQAGSRLNSASTKGGKADLSTATTPDINTASATKKTTAANVTLCSQTTMSTEVDSLLQGQMGTPDGDTTTGEKEILESEAFQKDLVIMERVINLNTYQPKLASYRDFPIIEDMDKKLQAEAEAEESKSSGESIVVVRPHSPSVTDAGPNLDRLWAYHCTLTKDRNISCVTWNRVNPDLVAVSYGQYDFSKQKGGLICCWSIKNPEYPERVYICQCGVMSLDFSQMHPNLLAAGLYDGTVAIYNVRSTSNEAVLDTLTCTVKAHNDKL